MKIGQVWADLRDRLFWREAVGRVAYAETQRKKDYLINKLENEITNLKCQLFRKDERLAALIGSVHNRGDSK